jgi:hypothetical protein
MASSYAGKPCPKCKYVRAASDTAPDWQCPKCGVAYAKFPQAQSAPAPTSAAHSVAAPKIVSAAAGESHGMAIFAHLSILLGAFLPLLNIIVPVVIWNVKRGEDELAVASAKEAINFQISLLLWSLAIVGGAMLGALVRPFLYVAMLLAVILALAWLILPIIAAVKVSGGQSYLYPRTWHIFE